MLNLPEFPERLDLASLPTRMRLLKTLTREAGGPNIWLKCDDQTGSVLTGNKVRKLEFLLADAIRKGADTVITCGGIQSNHCRATALACAQTGLKCVLLLRKGDVERNGGVAASVREGNLFLAKLAGARVHLIEKQDYVGNLLGLMAETENRIREEGGSPYSIPTGGSNGVGVWAYLNAGLEIHRDCQRAGFRPDAIVCASGSGGTQAGLTLAAYFWPDALSVPEVVGMAVCDSEDYFNRKVRRDIRAWGKAAGYEKAPLEILEKGVRTTTLDQYIGPGYARPYPEVMQVIGLLARSEGVVLDPVYTGKAFHGLMEEMARGRFRDCSNIVFVHTGGVFGLYPYADEFIGQRG